MRTQSTTTNSRLEHHARRRRWAWALPIALLVVTLAPWYFYQPDDLFIHLRFADNLVHHGEWAFNPGEPVAGNTSPPWVILIAVLMTFGVPALVAAKALATATVVVLVLLVGRAARLAGATTTLALATATIVAGSHWLRLWSAAGMETPLAPALLLAGVVFAFSDRPRPALAGVSLGLATWARPDALPAAVAVAIGAAWALGRHGRVKLAHAGIVAGMAWPLFSRLALGRWLPLSVSAKGGGGIQTDLLMPAVQRTVAVAASEMLPVVLLASFALLTDPQVREGKRKWLALLVAALTYPTAYILNQSLGGVEATGRYLAPWFVLAAVAVAGILSPWWNEKRRRRWILAATGLTLAQSLVLTVLHTPAILRYDEYHRQTLVIAAEWVRENARAEDAVAAGDIGVLGYVGQVKVLDLSGIVNPKARTWARTGETFQAVQRLEPRYFINPAWRPGFDSTRLDPFTVDKVFVHQHTEYRWTPNPGEFEVTLRVLDWKDRE